MLVHFIAVSTDSSSDGLFIHVQNVVSNFNLESKHAAETCDDGASVVSGHWNRLKHRSLKAYPHTLHVPCYAHVLRLLLSQSLSNIKECTAFFFLKCDGSQPIEFIPEMNG